MHQPQPHPPHAAHTRVLCSAVSVPAVPNWESHVGLHSLNPAIAWHMCAHTAGRLPCHCSCRPVHPDTMQHVHSKHTPHISKPSSTILSPSGRHSPSPSGCPLGPRRPSSATHCFSCCTKASGGTAGASMSCSMSTLLHVQGTDVGQLVAPTRAESTAVAPAALLPHVHATAEMLPAALLKRYGASQNSHLRVDRQTTHSGLPSKYTGKHDTTAGNCWFNQSTAI